MPVYVYLMEDKNPLNNEVVALHIAHLRTLDNEGRLIVCGPFTDFKGGMVVLRAHDKAEANQIAMSDPFINGGFKTYEVRTLEVADASNGYLG